MYSNLNEHVRSPPPNSGIPMCSFAADEQYIRTALRGVQVLSNLICGALTVT